MMELNKNSFFFYVLKRSGGKIDPRNIEFMIEALKEWLPDEHNMIVEESDLGWNNAIRTIKDGLKGYKAGQKNE
jgi:hypothetical protein